MWQRNKEPRTRRRTREAVRAEGLAGVGPARGLRPPSLRAAAAGMPTSAPPCSWPPQASPATAGQAGAHPLLPAGAGQHHTGGLPAVADTATRPIRIPARTSACCRHAGRHRDRGLRTGRVGRRLRCDDHARRSRPGHPRHGPGESQVLAHCWQLRIGQPASTAAGPLPAKQARNDDIACRPSRRGNAG
jgi:hypothetical protein